MVIEINDLECKRFGIVAARLTDPDARLDRVDRAARVASVDLLTTRVDVGDLARVHALENAGYRLMDTLVYYAHPSAAGPNPAAAHPAVTIRHATPADLTTVAALARAAFSNYIGHYHADPRLDNATADAAYVEWAEASIATLSLEAPVLVAQKGTTVVGFLTLRRIAADTFEIVLNAVHPNSVSKGVYTAMVAQALGLAQEAGCLRLIVSTQINNYAVQKVWVRLGFSHYKSLYTFHKWYGR